jgi:hypothetical protein
MRVIAEVFIPVLVIGYLVAAVAVAWERRGAVAPCGGPYANRTPTSEELPAVLSDHQAWLDAGRKPEDERRANLCQADLRGADLRFANLQGADLRFANLQGAHLFLG